MNDNRFKYTMIRHELKKVYPTEPKGNFARHLNTLAWLINGIVTSKRSNLSEIANKVSDGAKKENRIKRFSRWVSNENIELTTYFLPFARALFESLPRGDLTLVMDGSAIGRGCVTLIANVVYQRRALPLAWVVVQGEKGHFPEETHIALLKQVHELVPQGSRVTFLGDGEFDGIKLQSTINGWGWQYVCRTAKNITLAKEGHQFSFEKLGGQKGQCLGLPEVTFTKEAYGPVMAIAWWKKGFKEPIYLVTNMGLVQEACRCYTKRFRIETFFSDQKSREFHLHKSHLSDPARMARLMIAACLAYIWIIFLGVVAVETGWIRDIHRTDRCDLSLFHLGLDLLDYILNKGLFISVEFRLNI